MKGRLFDTKLRRFMTPDPFVTEPFNPQGLNRFSYVQNNPLSFVDPSGFCGTNGPGCVILDEITIVGGSQGGSDGGGRSGGGNDGSGSFDMSSSMNDSRTGIGASMQSGPAGPTGQTGPDMQNMPSGAMDVSYMQPSIPGNAPQTNEQQIQNAFNQQVAAANNGGVCSGNMSCGPTPAEQSIANSSNLLNRTPNEGQLKQLQREAEIREAMARDALETPLLSPIDAVSGVKLAGGIFLGLVKTGTKKGAERLVIGRGADLAKRDALKPGERTLSWLSKMPDAKAEWRINSGLLRQEMRKGVPIRDASPNDVNGMFLNAERGLLNSHGWTFDRAANLWIPPGG
jgi:hypothetical protein